MRPTFAHEEPDAYIRVVQNSSSLLQIYFVLLFIFIGQGCTTGKAYERYAGTGYYINLKPDNTFEYRFRSHLSGDTSAGVFYRKGDTLLLKYQMNNYDSIIRQAELAKVTPPIELMLSSNGWKQRPQTVLCKGRRLYLIDKQTGEAKKDFYLKAYK